MNLTLEQRASLAQDVFKRSKDYFESFEGDVGTQLTYLLGAILDGEFVELDCSFHSHREFSKHLQKCFDNHHPVWNYIQLEF